MVIRPALPADAEAACQVLRRSITELCAVDHGNDPALLSNWLANKTPDNLLAWMAAPGQAMLLAVEDGTVLAVGAVTEAGHIKLNYVSPDARFRGVSRAMLTALEVQASARGAVRCTLHSTETAQRFYLDRGYGVDGPPQPVLGLGGTPMSKALR